MKNDISAIGNALVDTVFKVEHSLIAKSPEIDQMTLSSAMNTPIIEDLFPLELLLFQTVVDLQPTVLLQQQALVPNASIPARSLMMRME